LHRHLHRSQLPWLQMHLEQLSPEERLHPHHQTPPGRRARPVRLVLTWQEESPPRALLLLLEREQGTAPYRAARRLTVMPAWPQVQRQ
jgi:hypothetical protein